MHLSQLLLGDAKALTVTTLRPGKLEKAIIINPNTATSRDLRIVDFMLFPLFLSDALVTGGFSELPAALHLDLCNGALRQGWVSSNGWRRREAIEMIQR